MSTRAWRFEAETPSLPEVHRSLPVERAAGFWRKLLAFAASPQDRK